MKLLLARHGNTFGPDDVVRWVGSNEDLPLVESGRAQARAVADWISAQDITLVAVYCAPLLRTSEFASIIVNRLGLKFEPKPDVRLTEINYGVWSGKTDQQIIAAVGDEPLQGWMTQSKWPVTSGWLPSEAEVIEEVCNFSEELRETYSESETVLAISSNGRLRYFLTQSPGEFQTRKQTDSFKMATGNISQIVLDRERSNILFWNQKPA